MKAVALFSGGLDSALVIKLLQEQGIEVVAIKFVIPFAKLGNYEKLKTLADELNVELKIVELGQDYVNLIKNPKHGYGKNINPCIDCKAFMLKKAKKIADEIGAKFIATGEVLNQRPMSQFKRTLLLIEKEAGLEGKIVRPLSSKLLPKTEAELKGWINPDLFEDIIGRQRKRQMELAKKFKVESSVMGAGGCELTEAKYAKKVRDLFKNKDNVIVDDIKLLRGGRYFRVDKTIIIVGRNEKENNLLEELKKKDDIIFDIPSTTGPIALVRGELTDKIVKIVAGIVARYSDVEEGEEVEVVYGNEKIKVVPMSNEDVDNLKINRQIK